MDFFRLASPDGPVIMAFQDAKFAADLVRFNGTGPGIFIEFETRLPEALKQRLIGERVVVIRNYEDYHDSARNAPGFPWADRVIRYGLDPTMPTQP